MTWKTTNTAKGDNKLYSDAKGVVPSLDLRFAESKTLNDYITGQNLITFSRADATTCATYVDSNGIIQTAAANVPRFDHDPATGESLGLLIEEARTNLIPYSSPANSWWTKPFLTHTSASVDNPFNYSAVRKHRATTDLFQHYFHRDDSTLLNANTDYTFSAFVAPEGTGADAGKIQLRIFLIGADSGFINFDLNTGQFNAQAGTSGTSAGGSSWSISDYGMQPYADGWYRVWMTFRSTLTCSVGIVSIDSLNAPDFYGYPSAATGGYYIAGIQVEQGTFRTSVIPTDGATVTRAADVAEITGANFSSFYNQSEGTVFSEYEWNLNNQSNYTFPWYIFQDGPNGVFHGNWGDTTRQRLSVRFNQTDIAIVINIPDSAPGVMNKIATTIKPFDYAVSSNGSTVVSYTARDLADNMVSLYIGGTSSSYKINGHIKRLSYFPTRLPDATLQSITS